MNQWIGPYGIIIPEHICAIIASDGCSIIFRDGSEDKKNSCKLPPTEDEYKRKYAIFKDNQWYYNYQLQFDLVK